MPGSSRITVEVPMPIFEQATIFADRAELNMTRYVKIGHNIVQGLKAGQFNTGTDLIEIGGQLAPLPPFIGLPRRETEATTETRRLILEYGQETTDQINESIGQLDIKTKTAYVIGSLNTLNGLVSLRDRVDPNQYPLSFKHMQVSDYGEYTPVNTMVIVEL